MPSRFEECLKFIRRWEGGKIDHSSDPGGRTAYGITKEVYDRYRIKTGRPVRDVFDIDEPEVRDIYLSNYWSPLFCANLPMGLDLAVFDAGVNCGTRRAAKWLQIALGMDVGDCDGVIGTQTLRYVSDVITANDVDRTIRAFQQCRADHYAVIVVSNPKLSVFSKGWNNRLEDCTKESLECRA